MKLLPLVLLFAVLTHYTYAQETENNAVKDSLYISEVEERKEPLKILHAEPLYIDLIRDLGARKGEREWNIGLGLTDNSKYDEYLALVEYEWAPADRLGLEIELPFSLHYPINGNDSAPGNKLNSIKLAGQYTFYVSDKQKISMAFGYIQEFELTAFNSFGKEPLFEGNVYNPFFIAAKRLGSNFHTLLYTGPAISHHFSNGTLKTSWQVNSNIHYMISGTRNFLGIEFNKEFNQGDFDMTIRPQLRLDVADKLLIGIVTGIQ
ncbi:HAEPLYID family protein [Leeuwenhoekiella marinoflava]|uniref:Outer membrane beta-barrel porin/alpha-amylase n=2 Tax=Leeuwenhoekiella marinoflava TaxID=988 RepID=A0A4Q0PJJ8_9FLAO|nr:HAEPLYID family protein [Leeuwenhoekiella marinoflava]RXG27198.1 hypothetical protein DSL99_2990 [Leeuwenhoekiella marinoflava]SHF78423.1 hypothetical protein SAMN02745246_03386 [Leeuwenhoekiella marinoflava DSM 3653]